jgi:O-antigen ligase/DNA-binding SARP family transcriptional activator
MSSKNYLRLLQIGVIGSLLVVFFVFSNLLFPFISSKQISFNLLMEFLLPFYLILMLKAPELRPRRSLIIYGLIAYLAVILLTCFTGVDFNLSFWGNTERMLGFFHVFHFFLLYLYLVTAFRDRESWSGLLVSSVVIAILESLKVLSGIAYGTIGNTAYVSGYLIFNLYFSAILLVRTKDKNLRWLWILPMILMLFAFNKTNTSGAIIGLGISILAATFLIGIFAKAKKIRRGSLLVFGTLLLGVIILFSQWQQPWFQENRRLQNLTSKKSTFQTRLVSWEGAVKDFKNHPWLGVGFGNYADVFDRQFNSRFYDYSRGETYFDRAHNNILDIISTTGVIGLLAYLSIFFFAIRELWKTLRTGNSHVGWNNEGRENIEVILLFCLLIAYFIQNLAVFDSLVTYVGLMITLALIAFNYSRLQPGEEPKKSRLSTGWELGGLTIGLLMMLLIANYGNLMPYRIFSQTIQAYSKISQGQIWEGYQGYKQAFKNPHPLARDCKTTFIRLISSNPQAVATLPAEQIGEIINYVVQLSEENLAENPKDSLKNLEFAQLMTLVSRFQVKNSPSQKEYYQKALGAFDQSIASSPGRATTYFAKSQILINEGRYREAEELINFGITLNPKYPEGYCRLSTFYYSQKKSNEALASFKKCAELDGLEYANIPSFLMDAASSSVAAKDFPAAIKYTERLTKMMPGDYRLQINLAQIYERDGQYSKAIEAALLVKELEPSLASDSLLYIKQLEQKILFSK